MGSRKPFRSSVRVVIGALVTLALGCGVSGPAQPPLAAATSRAAGAGEGERWLELETPHFIVHTSCYAERAVELAQQLEQTRAMLLRAAWPMARDPGGQTHVVIFAAPADFQRYSGLKGTVVGAAFTRGGGERIIAFSPGASGGVPRVAIHELAHDLSRWFLPLQPAWLAEGMAVYLENTRMASGGQVVMGEASEDSLRWMTDARFFASAQMLFATASPHSNDPRDATTFYAGSWFLVTYLLNNEGPAFSLFQKRLHQLVPWRRAWDEAFDGMTAASLDQKLSAYARRGGNIVTLNLELELPTVQPRLRLLSPAEMHGVKAELASLLRPDLAEQEARAALALDPDELRALSVQFRSIAGELSDHRQRIAERAVAAHPSAGEAWLLQATAASDRATQRRALERAAALDPSHPGVALRVAQAALERGDHAVALERVRFALRRSTLTPIMLGVYAAALEAAGRCVQAASVAENASALFGPDCRVSPRDTWEQVSCAAYVQSQLGSPGAPCKKHQRAPAMTARE